MSLFSVTVLNMGKAPSREDWWPLVYPLVHKPTTIDSLATVFNSPASLATLFNSVAPLATVFNSFQIYDLNIEQYLNPTSLQLQHFHDWLSLH